MKEFVILKISSDSVKAIERVLETQKKTHDVKKCSPIRHNDKDDGYHLFADMLVEVPENEKDIST